MAVRVEFGVLNHRLAAHTSHPSADRAEISRHGVALNGTNDPNNLLELDHRVNTGYLVSFYLN